jgi:predicted HicB family RNase H-like nuclease
MQQKPRLLGIIRTQFSHHSKSWIYHHTRKARFRSKITFHDGAKDFKKDINNSLREIQENTGKELEALKEETQKSLKELQENTIKKTKEQNRPRSKNVNRNNKEITKGDNSGVKKPRKEVRSHRCKHHQQNTRYRRESQVQKIP